VNKITVSLFFRKAFTHSGDVRGLLKEDISRKGAKAQRDFLSALAPLREKKQYRFSMTICAFCGKKKLYF
jgi:hypothetical protein